MRHRTTTAALRPRPALRLAAPAMSVIATLAATPAAGQDLPGAPETQQNVPDAFDQAQAPPVAHTGDLWKRNYLGGDLFGLRGWLGGHGISLGASETSEVFGNATGGLHRGADYDGLTQLGLGIDTGKAFGLTGGNFNVSALWIHGRSVSDDNLDVLDTVSGIEADRALRLWELWYQQSFLDGQLDVKIGKQSLDQEFLTSQYAATFTNTMLGWPILPSVDMYAGGPAYPLASPGLRLRAQLPYGLTLLAGVFDDNPTGGSFDAAQQSRDPSGTRFNFSTGAIVIAELQYALNQPSLGTTTDTPAAIGLPGTYKLGAWFDSGAFPDQRYDDQGLPLASPDSDGQPRLRHHDFALYGVIDQVIWKPDPSGPRAIGVFTRLMGSSGDRNEVDFGGNWGVVLKDPLPGRDNDSFGVAYGLSKLGRHASGYDRDSIDFGTPGMIRTSESYVEVTYQYQAAPWWTLQPDFQYIFLPSGGVPSSNDPSKRIGNEAIFGLRTNIAF